jgi:hypothetical protein
MVEWVKNHLFAILDMRFMDGLFVREIWQESRNLGEICAYLYVNLCMHIRACAVLGA